MADWLDYKGIEVPDATPTGAAGLKLKQDLKSLVDWSPKSKWDATVDPDEDNDDSEDYYPGSLWLNTTSKVLFLCIANTTGSAEWTRINSEVIPHSEVWVFAGNGYGSTATKIRRFSTAIVNTGSAITYADSATNGASFTINEAGIYEISYVDRGSTSDTDHGVSVDLSGTDLTVDVDGFNQPDILGFVASKTAKNCLCFSITKRFSGGEILRPHTDGNAGATLNASAFQIIKISN